MCGEACGACGDGQACLDGQCREGVSCLDCGLQLRLLERRIISGKIARVVIAVELDTTKASASPRLIDLRIGSDRVVELVKAEAGPALLETGKDLFQDETTKQRWQQKPDKNYQVLAYSLAGTARVSGGRVMTLTFDLAEKGPVRFSVQRRTQTFAPLDADSPLQASQYDEALVVSL